MPSESEIKMVVGLGNPGKSYQSTRHNVGARIVDALEKNPSGLFLFTPPAFMNACGGPTAEAARQRGVGPEQVLVVCDDFALPLGALRIRSKGSSGGHHGLESILQAFGTSGIPRLRVGIGPVPPEEDPAELVLADFTREEEGKMETMIQRAAEAIGVTAVRGLEAAMNAYNQTGVEG